MRLLSQEIGHFLFGVGHLTSLPVRSSQGSQPGELARAARYFPLVGVLIGLGSGLVYMIAAPLTGPMIAAGLALAAGILLTGALPEDGIANFCAGLRAKTREQAFEIMQDGRLDSFGVIGLFLSLALRWLALATFPPFEGLIALILAHTISRAMLAPVMISGHFARTRQLATAITGGVEGGEALVAIFLALAVSMIAGPAAAMLAVAAGAVAALLVLAFIMRRFGGYTGDGLCAIQQASEICILIALAAALG